MMKMNEAKMNLKSVEKTESQAAAGSSSRFFVKEDNPMKIDLILQILFDVCPAATLSNCRLVCKQWKDVSLRAWRNKAILRFDLEGIRNLPAILSQRYDVRQLLDKDKGNDLQLQKYPFKNFRVDAGTLEYVKKDTKPITNIARHVILENISEGDETFLSSLHSLESLELRNCQDPQYIGLVTSTFVSRNVKRLKISHVHSQSQRIPISRDKILQHFPNLEALSLEYRTTTEWSLCDAKKIMETVKSIKQSSTENALSLRELEVINVPPASPTSGSYFRHQKFDKNLIDTIIRCDFPLERLSLGLSFSGEMKIKKVIRSMTRLLDSSRDSLQYLRTCFYFDMDTFIDSVIGKYQEEKEMKRKFKKMLKPIPDVNILMEVLKEMKVANGLWGLYLLAHLDLPLLEKLTVEYGNFERKVNILNHQVRILNGKVFPKLEALELLDNQEIPGPESIKVFANMMPNLCALSCPLDKQSFQVVCQRFNRLKTLNILGSQCRHAVLDDETLTGISNNWKWGVRTPNITDLASLTDLCISSDAGVFNDNSVMYGFLQLPKLYFLSVAFGKISGETKTKLLSHVKGFVQIQKEERLDLDESESDDDISTGESSSSSEESDTFELRGVGLMDDSDDDLDFLREIYHVP